MDNMDYCPSQTLEDILGSEEYQYQCNVANKIWVDMFGNKYSVSEMSTPHIKRCVKLIYKNNGNWRPEYLRIFEVELRKRKYEKDEL